MSKCTKKGHKLPIGHDETRHPCPVCTHEETMELYMRFCLTGNMPGNYKSIARAAHDGIQDFYEELYGVKVLIGLPLEESKHG